MNNESVDVIVPTYNGLPFLKETVQSVLSQTHKDLVLYIIDDGSTDEGATKKYVKSLKDPRVHYEHKQNGGQATARNHGIRISNSPYVAFVDADDVWDKNKLKKQLALFRKNPNVGMVYGLCKLIDAKNNIFDEVVWQKRGKLFKYLLGGNKISGSASMVLVKRDVFDSIGLFHEDFLIGEDWEMWLRIAKDYEIDYVPEFIASLRVLDNGMQRNYTKMAKGLDYMLPVMVKDFRLGPINRARLGKTCLKEACFLYYNGNDRPLARRIFIKSFAYNPFTFFTLNYHVWFLYLRILLGNNALRNIRRKFSASYRTRELESIAEQSSTIKNPLVSVILPAYNAEDFLDSAVKSILGQSFKDFELIIINDGSTDKTQNVIDSFIDPRIVCIKEKKNAGLVAALNKGLETARGKYIARQDADDVSMSLRLQRQIEMMHKHHHLVLVGTNAEIVDLKGKKIGELKMPKTDSAIRMSIFSFSPFVHGSVMYKSDSLKKVGAYKQHAWPAEDYDLWQRLLREGEAMNIAEDLYKFTANESGISQTNKDKQIEKVIAIRREVFKNGNKILKSPLTLRRAVNDEPNDKDFKKSARLYLRVSLIHFRPANTVVALLNLLFAVSSSPEKADRV